MSLGLKITSKKIFKYILFSRGLVIVELRGLKLAATQGCGPLSTFVRITEYGVRIDRMHKC